MVNSAGIVIASSDPTALQQKSDAPEVTEARLSDRIISRVERSGQTSFLRFAAPVRSGAETYAVLVDEPLNELEALTRNSRNTVTLTLTLGFALTFAVLSFVVRWAGLELERHQDEEERVKDLLGRYVSHQVAQQILAHGGLAVCAERREITVLFADIRGFTIFSEKLPPERVVALLNDYLGAMTDAIFKYDGTVDKFLGDGLMAIFGAPLSHKDEVCRAVACAQEMQAVFNQLRLKWRSEGLPDLGLGIGLNTGEGRCGQYRLSPAA